MGEALPAWRQTATTAHCLGLLLGVSPVYHMLSQLCFLYHSWDLHSPICAFRGRDLIGIPVLLLLQHGYYLVQVL